ncbi:GNAT family N-acetyltransferase [Vagococcus humatus]|uniref:GNAT family N-acetyltransferase n=1 Tax=Vagococcus humatus TaxID=1889241 RepID=A0A3R9YXN1_9ENTE|nr:GNAT family N-acetyltransferase [Vagococcus humatus]RST89819.1 GNAT family N-acetyltransferase [Vagococcus humatus]
MAATYVRLATLADLPQIMTIIAEAKELLKEDGSSQWQDGEPSRDTLQEDIHLQHCYLLVVGSQIAGVAALVTEPDPNYQQIAGEGWQKQGPYATIHRIAISPSFKGQHLGRYFFSNLLTLAYQKGFRQMRIDTHEMNIRMQSLIQAFGFSYQGIIYVSPNPEGKRLAYELSL